MHRECVVGLLIAPLAGCSLILDFSSDAIPVDAASDLADAPYTQADCDYLEPNNALAEAVTITTSEMGTAAICPSDPEDHDFYRFTAPGSATVSFTIMFSAALGDLGLRLLDSAGTLIVESMSSGDNEMVLCAGAAPACPELAAGDYVVEVFPATAGATNSYRISLMISAI